MAENESPPKSRLEELAGMGPGRDFAAEARARREQRLSDENAAKQSGFVPEPPLTEQQRRANAARAAKLLRSDNAATTRRQVGINASTGERVFEPGSIPSLSDQPETQIEMGRDLESDPESLKRRLTELQIRNKELQLSLLRSADEDQRRKIEKEKDIVLDLIEEISRRLEILDKAA